MSLCYDHFSTFLKVNKILKTKNIEVLRLPTKHCEYNPIGKSLLDIDCSYYNFYLNVTPL